MKWKNGVYTEVNVIRKGVEVKIKISDKIKAAFAIADDISKEKLSKEIVITSVLDGKHGKNSLHYSGNAFDIRTWIYTTKELIYFVEDLTRELGKDYDVVLESDHIHIEYDPDNYE